MSFVNTKSPQSRPDGHYAKVITQIADDGVCPFCPEHLTKYHQRPLIEKHYWLVTDNMYPYQPSKHHRLIIHKSHLTHLNEVSAEAWSELREIITEETKKLNITGGSFIARFGNTLFSGSSVTHLHAHILQSDPDSPDYDPEQGLRMRIG